MRTAVRRARHGRACPEASTSAKRSQPREIVASLERAARRTRGWLRDKLGHDGVAFAAALLLAFAAPASAADTLRIAVQKTGTVAWEIAVAKARGLDKAADLDIQTQELASTEAGKIALQGGAADMIVSDWLWVARERALGDDLLFTPYSTALGAVMAAKDSPVAALADLKGKFDRRRRRPDRQELVDAAGAGASAPGSISRTTPSPVYGAPPLIAEKLAQGETRCGAGILELLRRSRSARLQARRRDGRCREGARRQGAGGDHRLCVQRRLRTRPRRRRCKRYFAMLGKARAALASDHAAWAPIRARLGAKDDATFDLYRRRYLAGAPTRPVAEEAADARALFKAIADIGGAELTGDAKDLDVAAFYDPAKGQ